MGGPSAAEQAATQQSAAETAFYNQMNTEMENQYSGQQAILKNLQSIYQPIINQGINQYGFGAGEDTALRSQATEGSAQGYQEAAQALGDKLAASDDTGLPSGEQAQIKAGLASSAAQSNAAQQLAITGEGFQQGRQNFGAATDALSGVSQQLNPLGYASATNGAGSAANQGIDTLNTTEQSPWLSVLGGVAGGVLGGAANAGKLFGV